MPGPLTTLNHIAVCALTSPEGNLVMIYHMQEKMEAKRRNGVCLRVTGSGPGSRLLGPLGSESPGVQRNYMELC